MRQNNLPAAKAMQPNPGNGVQPLPGIKDTVPIDKRARLIFSRQPEVHDVFEKPWGDKILKGRIAEVCANRVALLWDASLTYSVHEFRVV